MLGMEASVWLVAMLSVVLAPAARAHHGWARYDVGTTLTLDGTIAALDADAPFVEISLRAQGVLWTVILAPTAVMEARGKPVGQIAVGDRIQAVGFRNRDDARELRAARLTHDGFTIELT